MVGFGPEDNHFVAELTYNYGVGEYKLGNDFLVCCELILLSVKKDMIATTVFFFFAYILIVFCLGFHHTVESSCQ